jgi:hypothetical protein
MLDQLNHYAQSQGQSLLFFAARHQGLPSLFQLYGANDQGVLLKKRDTKDQLRVGIQVQEGSSFLFLTS